MKKAMKIVVIVASRGRPNEISDLLEKLALQTYVPSTVILCGVVSSDFPSEPLKLLGDIPCITKLSKPGSCRQRNAGLDIAGSNFDIAVFFDDDYIPSKYALADIAATFQEHSSLVGLTGNVLADGVTKGGLPFANAERIVDDYDKDRNTEIPVTSLENRKLEGLYGCNMALRITAINSKRFDERLPLYGWLEDLDFSNRVGRSGDLALSTGFSGAHRGVSNGRSPGKKVGYSQIINPAYLMLKGTITVRCGLITPLKNIIANHVKSVINTEPWIDRRGRMQGNWIALVDLLRGRIQPEKILHFGSDE